MRFRMTLGIAGKRARDGFGSDEAKVVQIVGLGGMREIGVDDAPREIRAITGDAVEVILVGQRVELGNESAVLFDGSRDDEGVHAALERGPDHFAPFGFVAYAARFELSQKPAR